MTDTTTSHEAANKAIAAYGEEDKQTQLDNVLKTLPANERECFLPAASQAARVLELLSPALLWVTHAGPRSGVYSSVHPDFVVLIAASPKKVVYSVVPLADLDLHVEDALSRLASVPSENTTADHCLESFAGVINHLLEKHGCTDIDTLPPTLGMPIFDDLMVWRSQTSIGLVQRVAEKGVAPALLTLISEDGKGILSLPICYARHYPAELLAGMLAAPPAMPQCQATLH